MKRVTLLIASIFFLCSCAMHHYPLNPVGGNIQWNPKPESAVVIMGSLSDQYTLGVAGVKSGFFNVPSALYPSNKLNIIALHLNVGETFQLAHFYFGGDIKIQPYIKFSDTPVLNLDKPGIYYYGIVWKQGDDFGYSQEYRQDVIDLAKIDFYYLFDKMDPVNF